MSKIEEAVERFRSDHNCSQSILTIYGKDLGLNEETAVQLAGPFGGGMARKGQVCGAVTGSLMVLGLKYGSGDPGDKGSKERLLNISRSFMDRFNEKNENLRCNDLLGHDIGTPEGRAEAKKRNLFKERCPGFVGSAASILEDIMDEEW